MTPRPVLRVLALAAALGAVLPPAAGQGEGDAAARSDERFQAGLELHGRGDIEGALREWEAALALAEEAGDRQRIANRTSNVADLHASLERYSEALPRYARAIELARELGLGQLEADSLGNLGIVWQLLGNVERAIECQAASRARNREIGNRQGETNAVLNLAILQTDHGQLDEALQSLRDADALLRGEPESWARVIFLRTLGRVCEGKGEHSKAVVNFNSAGQVSRRIRNVEGIAISHLDLGAAYRELGLPSEAMREFDQALEISRKVGMRDHEAVALGNIGEVYSDLGEPRRAIEFYRQALDALPGGPESPQAIALSGNHAVCLALLGEHEECIRREEKVTAWARRMGDLVTEARSLANAAPSLAETGRTREALDALQKSIELAGRTGTPHDAARWTRAILFLPGSPLPETLTSRDRFLALMAPVIEALRLEMREGNTGEVVRRWVREIDVAVDVAWGPGLDAPVGAGGSWEGAPDATRRDAEASVFLGRTGLEIGFELAESIRAQGFLYEMEAAGFDLASIASREAVANRQRPLSHANSCRAELLKLVSGKPVWDEEGHLLDERRREDRIGRLRRDLDVALRDLALQDRQIRMECPALTTCDVREPVRLAELQASLARDELFLEYVLTGQAGERQWIRGEAFEATAPRGTGGAYLLAVTRSGARVFAVGRTADLEERVEFLRLAIEAQGWSRSTLDFAAEARSLFRELVQPAVEGLRGEEIRHIVLSPDGALARLPFDALLVRDPEPDAGFGGLPYLALEYSTEIAPSATVWVETRKGVFRRGAPGVGFVALADPDYGSGVAVDRLRSAGVLESLLPEQEEASRKEREGLRARLLERSSPALREALARGDGAGRRGGALGSLPGTRTEVFSIAPLFDSGWREEDAVRAPETAGPPARRAQVFLGPAAREARLRSPELLRSASAIHLACHGVAAESSPTESALVLTTEGLPSGEDGFITAGEVMWLQTNARVVTLSACESGLGRWSRGEGLEGLARAWQFAGARTVVVSLWKVDDRATSVFMKAFYGALLAPGAGAPSVTEALALARRQAASGEDASPLSWAAFVGHGER